MTTACVACRTAAVSAEAKFCVRCGHPLRQPDPYDARKDIPVVPAADRSAPRPGKPLEFDADPLSGRAYVAGEGPADAIPEWTDQPDERGVGGRLRLEPIPGRRWHGGATLIGQDLRGVASGAGRLVIAHRRSLSVISETSGPMGESIVLADETADDRAIVAIGWRTYVRLQNSLVVHDGRTGGVVTLSNQPVRVITPFQRGIAAIDDRELYLWTRSGEMSAQITPPFPPRFLLSDGDLLAIVGAQGEVAVFSEGSLLQVLPKSGTEALQAWIVNDHVGVRVLTLDGDRAMYASPGGPSLVLKLGNYGDVVPITGKSGITSHGLFRAGPGDPVRLYKPMAEPRDVDGSIFDGSALGTLKVGDSLSVFGARGSSLVPMALSGDRNIHLAHLNESRTRVAFAVAAGQAFVLQQTPTGVLVNSLLAS